MSVGKIIGDNVGNGVSADAQAPKEIIVLDDRINTLLTQDNADKLSVDVDLKGEEYNELLFCNMFLIDEPNLI